MGRVIDLVFLGPPGAGKGTQARVIADTFGLKQLSTGDALRAAVAKGTEAGRKAKAVMEHGELVSDDIVNAIVAETLDDEDFLGGVIFDGYPRTIAQADALAQMLAARGREIAAAIALDVDEKSLVTRISGRFTCENCGEGYHDQFKKPAQDGVCDICGEERFKRRADDNAEAVATRLQAYHAETAPLLEYYRKDNRVKSVNAMKGIDAVSHDLKVIVISVGGVPSETVSAIKVGA